jgi:HNH endonuclease
MFLKTCINNEPPGAINAAMALTSNAGERAMASFNLFDLPPRLQSKIIPEPMTGCWIWIGCRNQDGYGRVWNPYKQKIESAHQATYRFFVGEIPLGKELDHDCRLRCCANPGHVEPVTHLENMRRGIQFSPTHCPRGHQYIDGTYSIKHEKNNPRITKRCNICRREKYRLERVA